MAVWIRSAFVALTLATAGINLAARYARADEPAKSRVIDPAKLPPNAVIIVSDKPADALNNVDAVVLTPDEYKKLLAAAEQAKRLTVPDKPEPPSVCRLSGAIERRGTQDVAVLRADFQFRTAAARSTVLLGLQKAQPISATIDDGKLAALVPLKDDNGFAVQVDSSDEHRVVVDFETPVSVRGNGSERGLDFGLPGAAITTIQTLRLPEDVTRVRIGARSVAARQLAAGTERAPAVLMGPTNRFDLTWDVVSATRVEPQTSVDGRYDVRVEDHALITRARLTLKVQSGAVGSWEIAAAPTAEVSADAQTPDNPVRVQKPAGPGKPWIVRRDASGADLVVTVLARMPLTPGQPVAVPMFVVARAAQQRGTITVGGPAHLRLRFRPGPDVVRREPADESSHDAVFSYFQIPSEGSPLVIDVQPARGEVETQIAHQLTLAERGWRWQGKFDVRPVRTEVTSIDVEVPAGWQELRPTSAEVVEGVSTVRESGGRRLLRVQFAEGHRKPFVFALEGVWPLAGVANATNLLLPRPLGTLDRGGQLLASAPAGLELRGAFREWEGDRVGEWDRPLEPGPRGGLTAALERTAARVDLTWRTPRADVPVSASADIQLGERQAVVRHRWHFPAAPGVSRQVVARGPASLAGRLRAVEGGSLSQTNPGEWAIQLAAPAGRETVLVLGYSFPLTVSSGRGDVSVPLVWLDSYPKCETDVRVYSTATRNGELAPNGADGPWTEVPPHPAPDRPALPDLSLHGSGANLPLTLRLSETQADAVNGLVVDRLSVQAVVEADGQPAYRVRCVVRPRATQYLDVRLPAPPSSARFMARLDGKRLNWSPTEHPSGCCVRLRLEPPEAGRPASELELVYVLAGESRWGCTLTPPQLLGPAFVGPIRWQIGLTGDALPVQTVGAATFDWQWTWQHGLLAPRPAWTSADANRVAPVDGVDMALAGWQAAPEPLRFLIVPRPLALLFGSLAVVGLGVIASGLGPRRRLFAAAIVAGVMMWLAITRPQALTVLLYAGEPGAAVLIVFFAARWAARRRYRRRVLFLPTFAATGPNGSSAVRNGSSNRSNRREPSTVDVPGAPVRSEG